ncbi:MULTISPECIES: hypothetical protein [Burkholderia]|uniref:hypothetical protein n=1 Tax=Burkholderia TaxID=32008 RepID=UPI0013C4A192|nr:MULTISPECIES: hypothetical protein [Burkholderia]
MSRLGQRALDQFVGLGIEGRHIFGHSSDRTHKPDDQVGRFDRISAGREYPVHVVPGRQPHIRMQSIDTAYAVMQALDKECGVIGEPSLKFKSVEFSLPRKHHKFRATPHLQRSMRNARTVPARLVTHLLHRWNTIFAPPIRRLLQQAWSL